MTEELVIRHCAPTLAGIKTANLFRCPCPSAGDLRQEICRLNRLLRGKGLCILPLHVGEKDALIYVYRPCGLQRDLSRPEASDILDKEGYSCCTAGRCIRRLMERLAQNAEFPHEIGLFLGYPPEDVRGFMEQGAENCKLIGAWKVYGDAETARQLFQTYKLCTAHYLRQMHEGESIDELTVAV